MTTWIKLSNIITEAVADDLEAVLWAESALEAVSVPEVALEAVTAHSQILARARHILNEETNHIESYVCVIVYEYLYQPWHGQVCHETEMWGGVTLATDVFSSLLISNIPAANALSRAQHPGNAHRRAHTNPPGRAFIFVKFSGLGG